MRKINNLWIDFLIQKDKEKKEKEHQRPFVQPRPPIPPPKRPKKPKEKEEKDDDGVIIIDI